MIYRFERVWNKTDFKLIEAESLEEAKELAWDAEWEEDETLRENITQRIKCAEDEESLEDGKFELIEPAEWDD